MNARLLGAWPSVLVGSLALTGTACSITVDSERYSVREEKHWTIDGTPDLTLATFDGSIEVRSWDQPVVKLEVEKRAADRKQADAIEVVVEQSGTTIHVEAKKPPVMESLFGMKVWPSARLVALVPRNCNLVARTGDGSITIERIEGTIDLNTGDGSLTGTGVAGRLRAHSGDGSVKFEDVEGRVDVDTGDGGGTLTGKLSAVRFRSGDGSLTVRAEDGSAMADDWEIRTGDGGVHVELPETFGASLDASTGDGSVRVDGFGQPTGSGGSDAESHSLKRDLGAGGKQLRLRSGDGSITVRKL